MTQEFQFTNEDDGQPTVLQALRTASSDPLSWSAARKLLNANRVAVNGVVCRDESRRLTVGETVSVTDRPAPPPPTEDDVRIIYVDDDVVVSEKPSGMTTLRRKDEMGWSQARRRQQPTLDECVPRMIRAHAAKKNKSRHVRQRLPKLFSVHRIDRDSSGLLMFARTEEAQQKIIAQFADHKAVRKYLALVPGRLPDQTISTRFIRDRGDGLRGSTSDDVGQEAITHVRTLRTIGAYSELECRLETGRTNQIRIHLAELGHPICGDIKYRGPLHEPIVHDDSRSPRMALHAAELAFELPSTGEVKRFQTNWPVDMQKFLNRLRAGRGPAPGGVAG